jgi:hypothetical protein
MVSRNHSAVQHNVVIGGSPDPNNRFLLKGPALNGGRLNGVKQGKSNHTGSISGSTVNGEKTTTVGSEISGISKGYIYPFVMKAESGA